MQRTAFTDLEWNGRKVMDLDHADLLQLAERLHSLLWDSVENVERVISVNNALNERLMGGQDARLQ